MKRLWFHNIGSDPEFLFVGRKEFRVIITPANAVIASSRNTALQSYIGTDGHQTTAEMRPGPAHNIGRHLYDVAYGIHEIDKWLAQHKKYHTLTLTAQPYVIEEPLGGHIHCSFFLDEPLTKYAVSLNRTFGGGLMIPYDATQLVPQVTPQQVEMLTKYSQAAYAGELFGVDQFAQLMDHLLLPFECAIQPWWGRFRRNGRYGGLGAGERARRQVSVPKGRSQMAELAYLHYEYRVPSTWLCHPWLAYAYLALAKLSIINAMVIWPLIGKPKLPPPSSQPQNDAYRKIFTERLKQVHDKGKWSRDLRDLDQVIDACFNSREKWFAVDGEPINVDAWRKLL